MLVVRDLVHSPLPHISNATIAGFYTPPELCSAEMKSATALSDDRIAEVRDADLLLISTPMYNFSLPSALKAWVDQIVRIGHTFSYSPENGFSGLLPGKRAIVVAAYGVSFSSEAMLHLNRHGLQSSRIHTCMITASAPAAQPLKIIWRRIPSCCAKVMRSSTPPFRALSNNMLIS